ncbi:hypothetical protein AR687_14845 [Flavobacteriaceae bacterium CRH]|nr:hypothetical protein AR687_14845 [Flavobacteriaceae bacterium CRH]
MKKIIYIMLLIISTACNLKSNSNSINKTQVDSSSNKNNINDKKTIAIQIDTLQINGLKFIQTSKDDKFNSLVNTKGDTIIKAEDYYFQAEFLDINKDGYKDIRVYFFSSKPNLCTNYLFDKNRNTFRQIENCELDIQKLNGTEFYYSYNSVGCSDMDWESHLSKIKDNKLVNYGFINGKGCDFEIKENPQVIEIYKITNSEKDEMKLITSLPYLKNIPKFEDKWDFIQKYWKQKL